MGRPVDKELTDEQKEAVGQVMTDAFGAHIQSGWNDDGRAYVFWQYGPNTPILSAFIDENGTVAYGQV